MGSRRRHTAEFRRHPPPKSKARSTFFLDDDSVPELGGSRPRIVEQIVVFPLLHAPVPQTVDSVVEVLKILDMSLPLVEQVIEVPKIIQHTVSQRSSL